MSFFTLLHNLLIGPLELFFEVVYSWANDLIQNPGLSIIVLSLIMNFLVLPLYRRADAMQEAERAQEARMRPWVEHIRKTFRGDERFMMLQTYYRQNDYKPTDALKGSVSLLLEVPFFIAAYQFLSGLSLLKGFAFGPIPDLGAPDGLIHIAGMSVNLLPILMTVINFISGAIYTKGFPWKSKVQLYAMALIFLVFLYQSPSGLVFYWTLNNVFSLLKNIFYKLKHPRLVLCILSALTGLGILLRIVRVPMPSKEQELAAAVIGVALLLPVFIFILRKKLGAAGKLRSFVPNRKIYIAGALFITVLIGLAIPSATIGSSPDEFYNIYAFHNPIWFIINAFVISAGFFLVWCSVFYALANDAGKKYMELLAFVLSGIMVLDYMLFGTDLGNMSAFLKYDNGVSYAVSMQLINLGAILLLAVVLLFIYKRLRMLVIPVLCAGCAALTVMSVGNILGIRKSIRSVMPQIEQAKHEEVELPFSRTGKNVVVFMLDRALSVDFPYVLKEEPQLREIFSGFTYYANTISYGGFTNVGTPALFGGYDYTPDKINARADESLEKKQNEALKVMPRLFSEHGYDVTVCDPPYAGYQWIPDLSIYDDLDNVHAYITKGRYNAESFRKQITRADTRNLFCYSVMKVAPVSLQGLLYNDGNYNEAGLSSEDAANTARETIYNAHKSRGFYSLFMDSYTVLQNLANMTKVKESDDSNHLILFANETTHEPMVLKEPEYEPALEIDNTAYDAAHRDRFTVNGRKIHCDNVQQMIHYEANVAAFLKMADWIEYLKETGVYDNTRIIIVSDHGRILNPFDDLILPDGQDSTLFHAMLMVKDFGQSGALKEDWQTFMTLGDIANLATKDVISNPVNPYTGTDLSDASAKEGKQHILYTENLIQNSHGNTFPDGTWYSVHDDIYDPDNWEVEGSSWK